MLGAIWLMVAVICLMSIDIGNVFWQRREVQKIADLAALAGAGVVAGGCANASANALANAGLNGLQTTDSAAVTCGNWNPRDPRGAADATASPPRYFRVSEVPLNSAHVSVSRTVPYFFVFNFFGAGGAPASRTVTAEATAARTSPLAALNIQSTLVTVDSGKSTLLNSVFGGLLGGTLNLSAVGWQGLLDTNINLLSYLDRLALNLGVAAGDYNALLATQTTVGRLLQAAVDVLGSGSAASTAIIGLQGIVAPAIGALPLELGDVLQLQAGTQAAGLNVDLQAFQLIQGVVQLANSKSAVFAAVPLSVPGIGTATVNVKVLEPPQLSAIGNPELAKADPTGPNGIFVRTAQVRTLLSVDLTSSLTSLVSGLQSTLDGLLSPITNLLNSVLTLNLVDVLSNLLCIGCTRNVTDLLILPGPFRFDVNIDAAAGQARITDFTCNSNTSKSLTVPASTSALNVRIGRMGSSAADAANKVFASPSAPTVAPVPLIDIGVKTCTRTCVVLCISSCQPRQPFAGGGIGLMTNTSLAGASQGLTYSAPPATDLPDITSAPAYQSISSSNVVNSLSSTLSGVSIQMYKPLVSGSGLGDLLAGAGSVISTLVSLLQSAVSTVLSPLLDPLVNSLLKTLGITLAQSSVGARLTCDGSVELVY
ncbi:TadG family pilus assembly protein [Variovorax terrae]|uniref:Pilus assembly protein TadG-related protein n=1 Tax=Variovorax terrae TaxID=2923278 RepID=A0A9X1VU89_9BURK|nr:TadG family pilus assembly protein [Variovorax terrae]MCJ0763906.1 pilus assembly protein TadG-related protein [Variovorax terrae]